jgi:hypothetical protein
VFEHGYVVYEDFGADHAFRGAFRGLLSFAFVGFALGIVQYSGALYKSFFLGATGDVGVDLFAIEFASHFV